MRHALSASALGLAGALLAACTPLATYPPENHALNPRAVVNEPIPTLMAEAVCYSSVTWGGGADPAINLPAGSPPKLYDRVIRLLGEGHPMTDPAEPAYHITQVRSRGLNAQVDIFIPEPGGTYRFATLSFRAEPVKGYMHSRTRWWDLGTEPPPPAFASSTPGPAPIQPVLAHD